MILKRVRKYTTHTLNEIKSLRHGDRVIIGGRVSAANVMYLCQEEDECIAYLTIDDDVDSCCIFLGEEPYKVFSNFCNLDQEILVKGRVYIVQHPLDGATIRVICSSIVALPKENKNESE